MINDLKLGMGILRYAYGIQMSVVLVVLCVLPDILCFALELMGIAGIDGYFLMAAAIMPAQLVFSLNAVNSVLSSPARKRLQTSVPTVMTWCTMEGIYVILILKKLIITLVHPDRMGRSCRSLILIALTAVVIMAFNGIVYKYFIVFLCTIPVLNRLVLILISDSVQLDFLGQGMPSMVWAALIGFFLITAGAALEYGLSLLVYKKPVSKMALGVQLGSQL